MKTSDEFVIVYHFIQNIYSIQQNFRSNSLVILKTKENFWKLLTFCWKFRWTFGVHFSCSCYYFHSISILLQFLLFFFFKKYICSWKQFDKFIVDRVKPNIDVIDLTKVWCWLSKVISSEKSYLGLNEFSSKNYTFLKSQTKIYEEGFKYWLFDQEIIKLKIFH